jgi:hypothetical protein
MTSMAQADARLLRVLWIGTLIALSAVLTATATCIAPFAALSVATAMTLSWRHALIATAGVWLANQAAGFGLLSYPWVPNTLGWGAAIGVGAMAGTLATQWLLRRLEGVPSSIRTVPAFALAFTVYEAALYGAAVTVLGGTGAFAPGIVAQVLVVNVVALLGLWGLNHLLTASWSTYRRRAATRASCLPTP